LEIGFGAAGFGAGLTADFGTCFATGFGAGSKGDYFTFIAAKIAFYFSFCS
jgi:hypothetical protein